MIIEPDFPDHWKTQLLIQLTGDPAAPLLVIRLWAFCQQRKSSRFTDLTDAALAAVCRWKGEPAKLREHLHAARFLDDGVELGSPCIVVHQWDEVNATLVRNWANGAKNGRRFPTQPTPNGHPATTQPTPRGGAIGEDKIREEKIDRIGEDKTIPQPQGERTKRSRKAKTGSITPETQPDAKRGRMLSLNAIFRRVPTDGWGEAEQLALDGSGLLSMAELDFVDACETVRAFYHASIPPGMEARFWKRTTLQNLLINWGGELDKARAWARERADGVTKV